MQDSPDNLAPPAEAKMTVLLVGEALDVLAAVRAALPLEACRLVGAGSIKEALVAVQDHDVDVIVVGHPEPGSRGVEVLATVRRLRPSAVRMLLTEELDAADLREAINEAQVFRILTRPVQPKELATSIRDALTLRAVVSAASIVWQAAASQQAALSTFRAQMRHLAADGAAGGMSETESAQRAALMLIDLAALDARSAGSAPWNTPEAVPDGPLLRQLSRREHEIMLALGKGRGPKEVAREFDLSTHTVRNHMKAIYRKLGVHSRYELLTWLGRLSRDDAQH